jgi:hypothetical protein
VREINLGLDFIPVSGSAGRGLGRGLGFAGGAKFDADFFGFMLFQRTGVGLLFGDANFCQHVKNGLALDFQFPG